MGVPRGRRAAYESGLRQIEPFVFNQEGGLKGWLQLNKKFRQNRFRSIQKLIAVLTLGLWGDILKFPSKSEDDVRETVFRERGVPMLDRGTLWLVETIENEEKERESNFPHLLHFRRSLPT